jgi:hypothetical protein
VLDDAFRPGKVVYAILLENGKQLSADTLFPPERWPCTTSTPR